MSKRTLVVGADSLIGAALMEELRLRGVPVVGTSRRKFNSHFFLDLASPIDLSALPEAQTIFLCAGINSFAACSEHSATAALVNVSATLALGAYYLAQGGHVVFLSSTSVFGTQENAPDEQATLSPNTTYGAFKCATEIALLEASEMFDGGCSVVRLSKVLSRTSSLLKKWLTLGAEGQAINAFVDLSISPISLNYVVGGLLEIANRQLQGCFHLAGEHSLSYADLAYALSERRLIPNALINKISQCATEQMPLSPQCNALAMPITQKIAGIQPQPLANFLDSI